MARGIRVIFATFVIAGAATAVARGADLRTPVLTHAPLFNLSHFALRPKEGVAWRDRRDGLPTEARSAVYSGLSAIAPQLVHADFARLTRGIAIGGIADSPIGDQFYGGLSFNVPTDLAAFSSLESHNAPAVAADFERRLMRLGADRLIRDNSGRDVRYQAVSHNSPDRLVEIAAADPESLVASEGQSAVSPTRKRPAAFDASEGTPLDPLLNTTYDLNFAKTVPSLTSDLIDRRPRSPGKAE
jgi:hypothetical protein